MNILGIEISSNTIQQGIIYILDPDNRILVIGIGILILLLIIKFIFRSIKRLLFITAIIVAAAYFYLNFVVNNT